MLTTSQVRAILDKMDAIVSGHFAIGGHHTAQVVWPMRLLQAPEYASSLASTLASAYRTQRPQTVLAVPGAGSLLGLELARALRARLVLALPTADGYVCAPGQQLEAGERVVLCEDVRTDDTDFAARAALVTAAGAQLTGACVLIDRGYEPWPFAWPLEALYRPEAPLHRPEDCPMCREGLPLTRLDGLRGRQAAPAYGKE